MKNFKQINEYYICEECNKECQNLSSLSSHIRLYHKNLKEYFDKYILEDKENICPICKEPNIYKGLVAGYSSGCCKKHSLIIANIKRKQTLLKLYGVENNFQRIDCKEKIQSTFLKNYGVTNPNKDKNIRKKIESTNIKKYGVKHNFCKNSDSRKRWEKKLLNDEGINNVWQREEVKQKSKQTCLNRYGVENANQNKEIFNKGLKTRFLIHKYKDTNLTYQGSYELDFLKKYYDKLDIQNGPSIKYKNKEGKNKVYHSDFYIPSKNLIIEIKSWWTVQKDTEIKEKKKATIQQGYKYLKIQDKKYNNFKRLYDNKSN